MRTHARIVIIGGGAIGMAIAYALARAGERDVMVLEKAQLTHGSTWHAAGLVGQLRNKKNLTRLMQASVAVFDRLETETGQAVDWRKAGSIRIASSAERMLEIRRSLTQAKSFGFEADEISAAEAQARFPWMTIDGVVGAAWIPSDGYIDPYALTMAYARAARSGDVTIHEGVLVTGFETSGRRITSVLTDAGRIDCDIVVNAAGIWAKRLGAMMGVSLATGAVEHQYVVTAKTIDVPPQTPTFRDPDRIFYLKPDVRAFAIGGWEEGSKGCWRGMPPLDFGRELFAPNMERLELFALPASERLPVLNETGLQTVINGPIPVSADGEPIMGPAPERDNVFVACGFTAGIAASGGAGEAMANWILEGDPGMDLWPFDARRFVAGQANAAYVAERSSEAYGRYYALHPPGEEMASARGARRSPLHGALADRGAVFGSKAGWERPLWFDTGQVQASETPRFDRRPGWFDAVGAEHRAVREGVALIDQSSFAKFEISGPGTLAALQRIAANDLDRPEGACVYTQFLNEKGGIEADVTLIRLGSERFYMVSGSGFGVRDVGWMRRFLPDDGSVRVTDVTSGWTVINLVGPRARDVLSASSHDDVSNEALPYLRMRSIEVGLATVRAARLGYVGELGYELHVPVDQAGHLQEVLRECGAAHGIADAGYRAIESLRLEKGYVYWSAEVTPETNPIEAGLDFAVSFDKGEFTGRQALMEIREAGPARRLATFTSPGFAPLVGGEAILCGGRVVGTTTSAGFGYTLGKTIALGYLPADIGDAGGFQIEAYGIGYDVLRGPRCLYDPRNSRLKM